MSFILEVLGDALSELASFGPELRGVLLLTVFVSLTATIIGVVVGVPLGLWLGDARFRGRSFVLIAVNMGMGIPPVLAGLFVLLLLWGDGPMGGLDLLFTPAAMIFVQTLLAIPIAAGVTHASVANLAPAAREQLRALDLGRIERGRILASEVRIGLLAAAAAAFGRVVSEVGAVLIVGGGISGETQVLTTAIVQESRQARFGAAVALGIVLLVLSFGVNGALVWAQGIGDQRD